MRTFTHKGLQVDFTSIGGVESCYILPDYKIAFETGRCPFELVDIPSVFLSHGHLDHSAGISYYFSQRSLKNLPGGRIYTPRSITAKLRKISKLWQKIEGFKYKPDIFPLKPGGKIKVQKGVYVKAIRANHRVDALGYLLIKVTKKLKPEFIKLDGREIEKRKKAGEDIFYVEEVPIFAYSGDTTIEFFTENEEVQKARVLFMETTYIDEKRTIERARRWGHTHLDELLENSHLIKNEKIVLVHLSRRYYGKQIQEILERRIPDHLKDIITYA